MVTISRFRSVWGIDPGPNQDEWRKRFVQWKNHGYAGIEIGVNFNGVTTEQLQLLRRNCDELGLEIAVIIFSSWPYDAGSSPRGLTPDAHIEFYREQLRSASLLKPVVITAQSGSDYWTLDESVYFYQSTLKVDKEMGLEGKICHETHRKRALFNPHVTTRILEQVKELRLTADISHWMVVCERLLDQGQQDRDSLATIIPHVNHIHARIGTTQSSQCADPTSPIVAAEKEFFEQYWLQIIRDKIKEDPNCRITWVPEYGPFPYHPVGAAQTYEELADSEGKRLEAVFNSAVFNPSSGR